LREDLCSRHTLINDITLIEFYKNLIETVMQKTCQVKVRPGFEVIVDKYIQICFTVVLRIQSGLTCSFRKPVLREKKMMRVG